MKISATVLGMAAMHEFCNHPNRTRTGMLCSDPNGFLFGKGQPTLLAPRQLASIKAFLSILSIKRRNWFTGWTGRTQQTGRKWRLSPLFMLVSVKNERLAGHCKNEGCSSPFFGTIKSFIENDIQDKLKVQSWGTISPKRPVSMLDEKHDRR